jgi:hypothetical protein
VSARSTLVNSIVNAIYSFIWCRVERSLSFYVDDLVRDSVGIDWGGTIDSVQINFLCW